MVFGATARKLGNEWVNAMKYVKCPEGGSGIKYSTDIQLSSHNH
jgi:hypothetical protein